MFNAIPIFTRQILPWHGYCYALFPMFYPYWNSWHDLCLVLYEANPHPTNPNKLENTQNENDT
jgi:hypothetical protein